MLSISMVVSFLQSTGWEPRKNSKKVSIKNWINGELVINKKQSGKSVTFDYTGEVKKNQGKCPDLSPFGYGKFFSYMES